MTNRITRNIANTNIKYLNEMMEEIGSNWRFGIEHPWSADFLAVRTVEMEKNHTWGSTYNQCGFREINDGARLLMDVIYKLQSERLLKRKEN